MVVGRPEGVELVVLEGAGHFAMIDAPEQFNPVLAARLASFGRERPASG